MVKSKELKLMRKKLEKLSKESDNFPKDGAGILPKSSNSDAAADASDVEVQYWNSNDIVSAPKNASQNKNRLEQFLQLFERNMADQYRQSSWGLNLPEKKEELSHAKARYLVLLDNGNNASTETKQVEEKENNNSSDDNDNDLIGYCHYRFDYDDDEDPTEVVLYVYELQIAAAHRRRGYGRQLMVMAEELARSREIPKVMLTVFKANTAAMEFYTSSLKYTMDPSSPSQHKQFADYEILCKQVL